MAIRGSQDGRGVGTETPIESGIIARVSGALSSFLNGRYDSWFGPLRPPEPVAPKGTRPRNMDYPTGVNISYVPRSTEVISFDQLRRLSENYDLMRLVIETRKDQLSKMPFSFKLKPKDGETKGALAERAAADVRIKQLEDFFKKPDRENTWRDWTRMIADDLLVTDAVSILPRFTFGGDLLGFDVVDGGTIRRVITEEGKTPVYPDAAYQQVLKGVPAVNLTAPNPDDKATPQLIYRPRNKRTYKIYGYSPVEQVIMTVNIALRRQLHQLQFYTEGNIPDAIIGVPPEWTPQQINQFEALWADSFEAPEKRRKIKFVPGGMDVTLTKGDTLKDEMDEWLARIVAFAFSIPPSALVKQVNRASGETMQEASLEEGLEPLLLYFTDLMNELIELYFGFDDIEFSYQEEGAIDPVAQSEVHDVYLRNGVIKINEARKDLGLDPLEEDFPNAIYTATGATTLEDALTTSAAQAELAANPPEPPAPNGAPPKGGNKSVQADALKKNSLRVSAGTITKKMKSRTPVVRGRITKFFDKEKKRIAKSITAQYAAHGTKSASGDRILQQLDLDSWTEELKTATHDELVTVFMDAAKNALADIAVDDYGVVFGLLEEESQKFAETESAKLVTRVTATTREKIRVLVEDAIVDGLTPAELSKAIEQSQAFSKVRADMIARTELAKANVAGNVESWIKAGVVVEKQWILGSEHDGEDECDDNADEGQIAILEPFTSGDEYPPAHPNCICDVVGVTKTK
jgi:hypothetical protein